MKKIKLVLCITTLLSFFAISVNAAVTFLPNAGGGVGGGKKSSSSSPNNVSSKQRCINAGYKQSVTSCSGNLVDKCSYNSAYFRYCCGKEYMYTARECTEAGLRPGTSCGGLYKCM